MLLAYAASREARARLLRTEHETLAAIYGNFSPVTKAAADVRVVVAALADEAASQPREADDESAAWAWMARRFLNVEAGHDPNDRDYGADDMVDAFIAGCAAATDAAKREGCRDCGGSGANPTPIKWPGRDCPTCEGTGRAALHDTAPTDQAQRGGEVEPDLQLFEQVASGQANPRYMQNSLAGAVKRIRAALAQSGNAASRAQR